MVRNLFGLLAVAVVAGFAAAEDKVNKDKAKLAGTYTVVSGEKDGKEVPKERLDGSLIVFTEKTVVGTDKGKKEFYSASYTLDTSKTPWAISMTAAKKEPKKEEARGEKKDDTKPAEPVSATGLIKMDGDTVTVIYALPGGKTPTEFKTGENQQMFVLKRKAEKE